MRWHSIGISLLALAVSASLQAALITTEGTGTGKHGDLSLIHI